TPENTNPFAKDKAAISAGREEYEAACGSCHGATGKGGRGPRLAGVARARNMPDKKMFDTIKEGVKGTPMPPFSLPDIQIWQLLGSKPGRRREFASVLEQGTEGTGPTKEILDARPFSF